MKLMAPETRTAGAGAGASGLDSNQWRQSLERGDFLKLHYQPMVDAVGVVQCVEALLRTTDGGPTLSAPELIHEYRALGLLSPMGWRVQRMAMFEFASHNHLHGMPERVAINAAPEEFDCPGYADRLLHLIQLSGLAPRQVTVEITEDAPLARTRGIDRELDGLIEAGVCLALDDLGSGNNGLPALLRTGFSQVKLDRCFIQCLHQPKGEILIGGMIETAHRMGLEVVVEGVETAHQATVLRGLGCDLFQGYYFARPGELSRAVDGSQAGRNA